MLIVTGHIHVAPADLAEFQDEFRELAAATRRRSGNLAYDAAVDDAEAGRLLIAERWEDQSSLTAHLHAEDTVEFIRRWEARMSGAIRKYDACNERGLMDP